jgi:hypothetical protein
MSSDIPASDSTGEPKPKTPTPATKATRPRQVQKKRWGKWYSLLSAIWSSIKDLSFKPFLDYCEEEWRDVKGATIPIVAALLAAAWAGYHFGSEGERNNIEAQRIKQAAINETQQLEQASANLSGVRAKMREVFLLFLTTRLDAVYYHRLWVLGGSQGNPALLNLHLALRDKTDELLGELASINESTNANLNRVKRICRGNAEIQKLIAAVYEIGAPAYTQDLEKLDRQGLEHWRTKTIADSKTVVDIVYSKPMEKLIQAIDEEIYKRAPSSQPDSDNPSQSPQQSSQSTKRDPSTPPPSRE